MTAGRLLYGFHAVASRIRQDAGSVSELYVDATRRDARMRDFKAQAERAGLQCHLVDARRLQGLVGHEQHQGVVAVAQERSIVGGFEELLERLPANPLLLVLDGVTDPHNLGACLRACDGAGGHAVIAPKDRACGLTATVAKVASGAADAVPYVTVTNLARTLRVLKDEGLRIVGAAADAPDAMYAAKLSGPLAIVMGAEGQGMRRLTREACDELVRIPMAGAVASLNVAVASAIVLFEAVRQRQAG